jgi:hypothetical protein
MLYLLSTTIFILALSQQSTATALTYSYVNTKGCLQTNLSHLKTLEMTKKGNGLDVGDLKNTTVLALSCFYQGYTSNSSFYFGLPHESIPKFIIDKYDGVSFWIKPQLKLRGGSRIER